MEKELITALVAFLLAGAAWFKSHSEVAEVKADREQTKKNRDTEIALLKSDLETQKKQADDFRAYIEKRFDRRGHVMKGLTEQLSVLNGNVSFIRGLLEGRDQYDKQLKETNKNISDLISTLHSSTRNSGHTPDG